MKLHFLFEVSGLCLCNDLGIARQKILWPACAILQPGHCLFWLCIIYWEQHRSWAVCKGMEIGKYLVVCICYSKPISHGYKTIVQCLWTKVQLCSVCTVQINSMTELKVFSRSKSLEHCINFNLKTKLSHSSFAILVDVHIIQLKI